MKSLTTSALLALSAGLCLTPTVRAQSVDSCSVFTCMAGESGFSSSGGPACTPSTNYFFGDLVVYDEEGFDAPATAALRYMYMNYCPGSQVATNPAMVQAIVEINYGTP